MAPVTDSIMTTNSLVIMPGIVEEVVISQQSSPAKPFNKTEAVARQLENAASIIDGDFVDYGSDQRDMERMGRKVELRRTFSLHSVIGFSMILNSSWIFALLTGTYTLANGGLAGTIWMFVFTCAGMFMVMLSMAELASITPSSGAQYHWTSLYAPMNCHKFLSFTVGWLAVFGWMAAMILTCYFSSQQVQSLISLWHAEYIPHPWHSSILTVMFTFLAVGINIFLVRKLAFIEGIVFIVYIAAFIFFLVVFWVMGEHRSADSVFTEFSSDDGWPSTFLACIINISSPVITLVGADSSCHLSEEMRNASWGVPRAMVTTALLSYGFGFLMQITFLFNTGNIDNVENTNLIQSYVAVLLNTTGSRSATTVCVVMITFLMTMCTVNQTTTASRQIYAFARDNGLPFSNWLCTVRPGWDFPLNALLATLVCSIAISLTTIYSNNVFTIINTLTLGGLLVSYLIAIGVVFWRKIQLPDKFPVGKFIVGRKLGLVVNFLALAFLTLAIIFSNFPSMFHPTAGNMNWSTVTWTCATLGMGLFYWLHGRKHYMSPVERARKHE